jgi:hypothetical protein
VSESDQSHVRCRRYAAGEIDTPPAHTLKAEIDRGLADLVEGRMQDFDVSLIVARGRQRLAARPPPDFPSRPARTAIETGHMTSQLPVPVSRSKINHVNRTA